MSLEEEVKGLSFIDKFRTVIEYGELDYWEERKNPPNLSREDFINVLYRIDTIEMFKWAVRESEDGPYGRTGEDDCFKFECQIEFGGFFEKSKLIGVTIQSFREV